LQDKAATSRLYRELAMKPEARVMAGFMLFWIIEDLLWFGYG